MTPWHHTPEAQQVIARIIAEQPAYKFTRGGWIEGGGQRRYLGTTAARLRRIYNQVGEELFEKADAALDAGTPYAEAYAEFNAWVNDPPDKLIARLVPDVPLVAIGEPVPEELKRTGTGGWL